VSTEKQVEHGVSLAAQHAKVSAYAELYDLDLIAVEVDGLSAKTLDRPALVRALAALTEGRADGLLVVKLDRLTRSVRDLGDLVDRYFAAGRWALVSVSENIDTRTAAGRLVLNVLGAVSQWEREAIGERTATALAHKRSCGEIAGTVPYGFRLAPDGVHIEKDVDEHQAVDLVRELRAHGLTLRAIAQRLDASGRAPRGGGRWHPQTVANIARATTT
jgi:DNA invertase Pin-like site-specific DNA recombinase